MLPFIKLQRWRLYTMLFTSNKNTTPTNKDARICFNQAWKSPPESFHSKTLEENSKSQRIPKLLIWNPARTQSRTHAESSGSLTSGWSPGETLVVYRNFITAGYSALGETMQSRYGATNQKNYFFFRILQSLSWGFASSGFFFTRKPASTEGSNIKTRIIRRSGHWPLQ